MCSLSHVRIIPILAFTFGRAHARAHVSAWRRAGAHSHHTCSHATRARAMLPRACATQTHDHERADPVTTAWQAMQQWDVATHCHARPQAQYVANLAWVP